MRYKKELLVSIVICTLIAAFSQLSPAVEDTESSSIVLDVGSQLMIDLTPASFSWTGGDAVNPGATGAIKQAQIENIGSVNITNLWFNVTQPSSNPYGTGLSSNYNSSNFVWVATESGSYYAVDRLEFNETRSLIYIVDPDGSSPPNSTKYAYGRFRDASNEYFWIFTKDSVTQCSDITFYVGDVAHTEAATGSVDFSSCSGALADSPGATCRSGTLLTTGTANYCYSDIDIGGSNYTIAVSNSTLDRVRWSHWNIDLPGAGSSDGMHVQKFYSGTIYPGNSTVANLTIHLSYGVKEGTLGNGNLFVIADDQ